LGKTLGKQAREKMGIFAAVGVSHITTGYGQTHRHG